MATTRANNPTIIAFSIVDGTLKSSIDQIPRSVIQNGHGYPYESEPLARRLADNPDDDRRATLSLSIRRDSWIRRLALGALQQTSVDIVSVDAEPLTRIATRSEAWSEDVKRIEKAARSALGIVIYWPLSISNLAAETGDIATALTGLSSMLPSVAKKAGRKLRVTIAIEEYEHAIVAAECALREPGDERSGAEIALAPEAIRENLSRIVADTGELYALVQHLCVLFDRVDVIPVSLRGVIKEFGEANYLPAEPRHQGSTDAQLISADGGLMVELLGPYVEDAASSMKLQYHDLWVPLLQADPFIFSAFGTRHERFVDARELLPRVAGIRKQA